MDRRESTENSRKYSDIPTGCVKMDNMVVENVRKDIYCLPTPQTHCSAFLGSSSLAEELDRKTLPELPHAKFCQLCSALSRLVPHIQRAPRH